MGKNKKQKQDAAPAAKEPLPEIPLSTAALPIFELDARALGELLELCFPDRKLLQLCGELRLYSPGYRIENMPPNQVARMLADEAKAAKDAAALLEKEVREALRDPAFEHVQVTPQMLNDAIDLFAGDPLQHLARIVWRARLEPASEEWAKVADGAIALGIDMLDATAQKPKTQRKPQLSQDVKELQEQFSEAQKRAERAEKERDSMREQLAQARGETAEREKALADARAELSQARAELGKLSTELTRLTDAGAVRALSEARKSADEARALSDRLRERNAALEAAEARVAELEKKLAQQPAQPVAAAPEAEDVPSEEEAATFLIPFFTREFYDSIARWDRRMQRAAFDKVALLARDWRHGSLRALALEGLPGYYRIRIATDVRLIYRRGEGNALEILSLIDREDLDRYVRQARTR